MPRVRVTGKVTREVETVVTVPFPYDEHDLRSAAARELGVDDDAVEVEWYDDDGDRGAN